MRTAIFTCRQTTLTIEASEVLDIVQMGRETNPIRLNPGVNRVVVGPGVFKVVSRTAVIVTADAADTTEVLVAATLNNKDAWPEWPEPAVRSHAFDREAVLAFFSDARGRPAPR